MVTTSQGLRLGKFLHQRKLVELTLLCGSTLFSTGTGPLSADVLDAGIPSLAAFLWLHFPFSALLISQITSLSTALPKSGSLLRSPGREEQLQFSQDTPTRCAPSCTACPLALCISELFSLMAPPHSSWISWTLSNMGIFMTSPLHAFL